MKIEEIIKAVAKQNHSTPEEVEKEMRMAIREAMNTKDPQAQELWKRIAPDGKEPSIERFFQVVSDMIDERMGLS